ncbi:ABC transporter permease [Glutamicibacter soli]|uniref:ABC transporter permease n=1 Tax=Glutamicibacter soli TaxID=453836 RepID=A0A6L9G7T5_9MICC|nr:ABC transporter permease [Glutamicibacter soli]NAZ17258.1 ABC transporter permease [Glutamicibacter soli]
MSTELASRAAARGYGRVTLGGVLRSEMIRFFSLNSTRILVLVSIAVYIGIAAIVVWGVGSFMSSSPELGQIPGTESMGTADFAVETMASGLMFSQLILGVLGVLLFSGEFTTGSAVSTFLASPQRLRVLTAKIILITALTAVVQLVSTLAAYLVCRPLAENYSMALDLGSEAFQRVLWYGVLAVVMASLIGLALGLLLRNSAGGITSLVALFFVLPMIAQILMAVTDWFKDYARFMPDQLGLSLALPLSYPSTLETWQQLVGVAGWIVLPLLLAGILLKSRDVK